MQFARKARPEKLEAAKTVSSILAVEFKNGSFSPVDSDSGVRTITDRLAKETHKGNKPQVVFFTCETARDTVVSRTKSKSNTPPKVTQPAEISQGVYDSVFDVVNARDAAIYTTYVDLTKVDIGNIRREQDRFINRDTGPFMVFYNSDGTLSGYLKGRMINQGNYCREISKILGSPIEARKRLTSMSKDLKALELLVSQNYVLKQKYAEARAQAAPGRTNNKNSRGTGSRGLSVAEKLAQKIKTEVDECEDEIASIKERITDLASAPITEAQAPSTY